MCPPSAFLLFPISNPLTALNQHTHIDGTVAVSSYLSCHLCAAAQSCDAFAASKSRCQCNGCITQLHWPQLH